MMSILQDLDPEYAKMQRRSSTVCWKLIAWVVSLLLVLTWATWLMVSLRMEDAFSESDSSKNAVSEQVVADAPAKASIPLNPKPPQSSVLPKVDALPAGSTGTAFIRESQASTSSRSNPAPPDPINQAMTERPIGHVNDKKTLQKQIESVEKKSASNAVKQRQNNGQANKAHTVPAPFVPTKRATERDIDIITAIVR